jgi:hypothetical protein
MLFFGRLSRLAAALCMPRKIFKFRLALPQLLQRAAAQARLFLQGNGQSGERFFLLPQGVDGAFQPHDHAVEGAGKIPHKIHALGVVAIFYLLHFPGHMPQVGLQGLARASQNAPLRNARRKIAGRKRGQNAPQLKYFGMEVKIR